MPNRRLHRLPSHHFPRSAEAPDQGRFRPIHYCHSRQPAPRRCLHFRRSLRYRQETATEEKTGIAFLVHEQNDWFFQRSAFLHHLLGWTFLAFAIFPLGRVIRPRSAVFASGFALAFVVVAVVLFCDRDVAPVFGHLSPLAGEPHR